MSVADKITRLSNARDDIIDALGTKGVTATGHGFEDFADDIESIQSGGSVIISDTIDSHGGTIREITTTGDVVMLQEKTVTPSTSAQVVVPSSGYDGMNQVTVNPIPSQYIIPSGTSQITENGMYDIRSYASVNVSVAGGGGGDEIDGLIMRTISGTYSNSTITKVGNFAFYGCNHLSSVNLPLCSDIGIYAFYSCTNLTTASFQSCTDMAASAFTSCSKLTNISFPQCTVIGSYAFRNCYSLLSASFPECIRMNPYGFYNCSQLEDIYFPKLGIVLSYAFYSCKALISASFSSCTTVGSSAFYACSSLRDVSLPICTYIYNYAFANCSSLVSINLPQCSTIYTYAFSGCSSLTTAVLPVCKSLQGCLFSNCVNLLSLYLLVSSSICTLQNANVFYNTPISDNTTSTGGIHGSVFVRASLYSAYISATNWTTYSARLVSLTDAEIEALGFLE